MHTEIEGTIKSNNNKILQWCSRTSLFAHYWKVSKNKLTSLLLYESHKYDIIEKHRSSEIHMPYNERLTPKKIMLQMI